jgi:hypothetical protein
MKVEYFPGIRTEQLQRVIEKRDLGSSDSVAIHVGTNDLRRTGNVGLLVPLPFVAYVNDIWRNIESTIRLFADDCVIYRKIINNDDRKVAERSGQAGGVGG